jgi:hypothetical protein
MATITKKSLISDRDELQQEVFRLQNEKSEHLEARVITVREFNEMSARQYELQNRINRLNVQLFTHTFESITVSDDSPGTKLSASINRLKEAIGKLDDVRTFLNTTADVINALDAVIGSLASLVAPLV